MLILRKLSLYFFCLLNLLILTSCASITSGTSQTVSVSTDPECGAECCLQNDKGKWYLPCTPGSVTVHRSYQDLVITAIKPGYQDSVVHIKSKTKANVMGNVLLGGAIGVGVDCANGAAYDYPSQIVIPLENLHKKLHR